MHNTGVQYYVNVSIVLTSQVESHKLHTADYTHWGATLMTLTVYISPGAQRDTRMRTEALTTPTPPLSHQSFSSSYFHFSLDEINLVTHRRWRHMAKIIRRIVIVSLLPTNTSKSWCDMNFLVVHLNSAYMVYICKHILLSDTKRLLSGVIHS
jgi:hypothetical protein